MTGLGTRSGNGNIIRRECDEPMARRKGYLPCEHDCRNCLACIEVNRDGERSHVVKRGDVD